MTNTEASELNRRRFLKSRNKVLNSNKISEVNKSDFTKYISKCKIAGVGYGRLVNVCSFFYNFCVNFFPDQRLLDVIEDEYLIVFEKLYDGEIKQQSDSKKNYARNQVNNFQRFFRSYLYYMLGEAETKTRFSKFKIPEDVAPIRQILTKEQVEHILTIIPINEEKIRFFFAAMFASGNRLGELQALRVSDVYIDENDGKLMMNVPKTKTFGRTIELPIFQDYIKQYVFDYCIKKKRMAPEDKLFDMTIHYLNRRMKYYCYYAFEPNPKPIALRHIGRAKSKYVNISSHNLRHSSSTFFAKSNGLTYQQYCYKFGWKTSSSVPQRYFNKAALGKINFQSFESKVKESPNAFSFDNKRSEVAYNQTNNVPKDKDREIEELKNTVNKLMARLDD